MNANRSRRLGLWMAGWVLASTLPAGAAITAVTPPEGTVGSTFTLTGKDFGYRKGKVALGAEDCKVLSWTDTQVTCEVTKPQPAGEYTITVQPQGNRMRNVPQTYAPFTMRRPYIDLGEPLRLVTPYQVVTITGDFFGDGWIPPGLQNQMKGPNRSGSRAVARWRGRVGMRDTTGLTLECRVLDWSMNSITFQIPDGLTGICAMGVRNDVGVGIQQYWCTFTPIPPGPPKATTTTFIKETHENATGIFFDNKFWIFYTEKDLLGDSNNDIWASWYDHETGEVDTSAPDPGGESDAQLAPIVIDHELWLFHTGESGQLFFKRYTITGIDEETLGPKWEWEESWHRIGGTGTGAAMELAPVWNPIRNRIEVYYWNNNNIYMVYSDSKGATWSTTRMVSGLGTVSTAPSATFWRRSDTEGMTLLAFASPGSPDSGSTSLYAKVFQTRDGVLVNSSPVWWSPYQASQPFIGHLGEDYIGLVFENGPLDHVDIAKMDKKTGTWNYNPLVPYLSADVKRVPSFAVNMEPLPDPNDPEAPPIQIDAVAYLFWGNDRGAIGTAAYMKGIEYLGWWQEDGTTDTDVGSETTRAELFNMWPVVGVVDAPPFVLNGSHYAEECDLWTCTSLTFGNAQTSSSTFSFDFKFGPYFETGEKSTLKLELSASVHAQYDNTHKKTVDIATTLFRSKEGVVSVWYLAPKFRAHHIQWYDLTGNPTGNFIQRIEVLDMQLLSQEFDPREYPWHDLHGMPPTYFDPVQFPIHAVEDETAAGDWQRLATYSTTPSSAYERWFSNYLYWNRVSEKHLKWVDSEETKTYLGADIEWKIGVNYKEYFGFGVQGSFSFGWGHTVTVENQAELFMVPGLSNGTPFDTFRVDAYWLKPDPNGYWVPLNRRGTGDAPWFITYRISDITPVS